MSYPFYQDFIKEEDLAIHHVFINLIGMDQESFQQVKDWFKSQGIASLQQLLDLYLFDPSLVEDPKYRANGKTQYLDSWITANFSCICHFDSDISRKHNVFVGPKDWLNLKSITHCLKYGLILHHPPKVISQADGVHNFPPINSSSVKNTKPSTLSAQPTPVIKMTPVAKVNSAPVANTSFNQHLADTQEVIRVPRIIYSKELSKGRKIVDSNKATSTPVIPKTQAPKVSRLSVAVPSTSPDSPDSKVSSFTKDPIKESKTVVAINVPIPIASPVRVTPSVPKPNHIPSSPPMIHAVLPSSSSPMPLSPDSPPSRYTTPDIAAPHMKKAAALTRIKQRNSYKGFLKQVLATNTADPIPTKDNLKVDNLSDNKNGECFPSQDKIVDEGINKSAKANGENTQKDVSISTEDKEELDKLGKATWENSHNDVTISTEEEEELDKNSEETIIVDPDVQAATIQNSNEHTSDLLPSTSSLNNCPSISAFTCTHYEVSMSLPPLPTMVSLGSATGEINPELHHQVYPCAPRAPSKNKGESSGNALSYCVSRRSYIKETSVDVFRIIKAGLQALENSLLKIKIQDIVPMTDACVDLICYPRNTVCNSKKTDLEELSLSNTVIDHTSQHSSQQLISNLVFNPWDVGGKCERKISLRVPNKSQKLIPYKNKVPEIEIDPGPPTVFQGQCLISRLYHAYESLIYFTAMLSTFRTWIAYIQDIGFKSLLMATMILLSLLKIEILEVADPDHLNKYLNKIITHETLVIFRTWIAYIHKLLPSYFHQLNSNFRTSNIIHPTPFNKGNYLYHDHYMIQETRGITHTKIDQDILNEFKTWIAYIEEIKFKFLMVKIMISLCEPKVSEVEIDPGPHQHPVVSDHVNKSLPKMIIHGTMVVFMTWIGYIHKVLSSCLAQLNFNSLAPQYFTSIIIPQHHPRNALTYTKGNYLYHDHYMIPAI
jgi:hypothetical protein